MPHHLDAILPYRSTRPWNNERIDCSSAWIHGQAQFCVDTRIGFTGIAAASRLELRQNRVQKWALHPESSRCSMS